MSEGVEARHIVASSLPEPGMWGQERVEAALARLPEAERAELLRHLDAAGVGALHADFPAWLRVVTPEYRWDWPYQRLIYGMLQRITDGTSRRAILSVPPRHGKTSLVTVRYSAWRIERDPSARIITAAYNQDLANLFSRQIRRIVAGRGIRLQSDSRRQDDWETMEGGGLRAVGVGSGITGRGGNLIVIDDPIKGREESDSVAYRDRVWEWYRDDLYTRQEPGCAIVLITTRWHADDLVGRLLKEQESGGDRWDVLNLPALAEEGDALGRLPGQALCPDRFNAAELENYRRTLGRSFYALYQGRPSAAEGTLFKREWIRRWREEGGYYVLIGADGRERRVRVADCYTVATVDLAASVAAQADYTVVATWAVTPTSDLLLLDVDRRQVESTEHVGMIQGCYRRHRPVWIAVERNGLGLPTVQALTAAGLPIRGITQHKDKISRASGAAARYEAGAVYHPEAAEWLADAEQELLSFPAGEFDDFCDTVSLATQMIAYAGGVFAADFNEPRHVAADGCLYLPHRAEGMPLVTGWAFEPLPALVVVQAQGEQVSVLAECVAGSGSESMEMFAARVDRLLSEFAAAGEVDAADLEVRHYADERYCGLSHGRPDLSLQLARARGWKLVPASGERRERQTLVSETLRRGISGGRAALVVDGGCRRLVDALAGGCCYKQATTGLPGTEVEQNPALAITDALGIALSRIYSVKRQEESDGAEWNPYTGPGAGRRRGGEG